MSSFAISSIVFGVVFGGAMVGCFFALFCLSTV